MSPGAEVDVSRRPTAEDSKGAKLQATANAIGGPCWGHSCDDCWKCRRGRCCRRDDPSYSLPKLGEWNGRIYGELGEIAEDGEKIQCHCCGEWYAKLSTHVAYKHELTLDEYRAIFGLNATVGLVGPALREVLRQHAKGHISVIGRKVLEGLWETGIQPLVSNPTGRKVRLQELRERRAPERRAREVEKISATLRRRFAEGELIPKNNLPPGANLQAQARLKELWEDPEWKARRTEKNAEVARRRRKREQVTCVVCGAVFEAKPSRRRQVCSIACRGRQVGERSRVLKTSQRPEVRAKLSEKSKAQAQGRARNDKGQFLRTVPEGPYSASPGDSPQED